MPTPTISRDPMAKSSNLYVSQSDQNVFVTTVEGHENSKRVFVSPSPNQGPASQIDNHDTSWGGNPPTRAGGPISTSYDGNVGPRTNGNLPFVSNAVPGAGPYVRGTPTKAQPFIAGAVPTPNAGNRSRARHWKDNPTGHQPHGGVRSPDVNPDRGQQIMQTRNTPRQDPGIKSRKGY